MTSLHDKANPPPARAEINFSTFIVPTAFTAEHPFSPAALDDHEASYRGSGSIGNTRTRTAVVTPRMERPSHSDGPITGDAGLLPYRRKEVIGFCELYLADCSELLPHLASVDHCITDPPYSEITKANARTHKNKSFLNKEDASYIPFAVTHGFITQVFDAIAAKTKRWFVASMDFRHVAQLELHPPEGMRFVRVGAWVKNNSAPQFTGDRPAQGFEAIAIMHRADRRLRWNGGGSRGVWITDVERNNGHPTPKPLTLINDWVCKFTDEGDTVLDPFMGSGTTGAACAKLGRRFVGIEINEPFFDLACARIRATVAQGDLFLPVAANRSSAGAPMTDDLTDDDKARALRLAAESMEGAPKRWAERVAIGQTDAQLAQALEYEFGAMGGCSRDDLGVTYQGSGLKIWADRCSGSRSRPPVLEGQQTVSFARRVYGIADPQERQMALFP